MNRFALCLVLLWMTATAFAAPTTTPFFLHDDDRVVFYGDSITEQQMYARDVETFTLTRYPLLHIHFINSGWSGDRVTGGSGGNIDLRLTRDVINYKPTVVTIFLGMNDGSYQRYDEGGFQVYANGLTHIVDRLQKELPGVRLTLLTPSYFDYAAKPRSSTATQYDFNNPPSDYNAILLHYGDFVKRLGAVRHIPVADTNAPMAAATAEGRRANPAFNLFGWDGLSPGDGVHPNDAGHVIIAAAILKAWHAEKVSSWPLPDVAHDVFRVSTLAASLAAAAPPAANTQPVLYLVTQRMDTWHDFWKGAWKGPNGLVKSTDVPTEEELAFLRTKDNELNALREQAHATAQPVPHTSSLYPTGEKP